jgi:group I intron endonuclease
MIGIYKITSPTNKVYVGQSVEIENRIKKYASCNCKLQVRLYSSIKKYGWKNHVFEIIEECDKEELNSKERYWQDFYECIGKNGLNCLLTNSNDLRKVISEEMKAKISNSVKGFKHTEEAIQKITKASTGVVFSEERKRKISQSNKGIIFSKERKDKISKALTGRKLSKECLLKRSKSISGEKNWKSKIILNTQTGIYYGCIGDAAKAHNINRTTLNNYLTGYRYNKTSMIYT